MVLCAKIDYVGIAWYVFIRSRLRATRCRTRDRLISGSVGTIVYYGFQCNTNMRSIFLLICLINGLVGTVIPFWDWFNRSENKVRYLPCSYERCPYGNVYCAEMAYHHLPLYDLLNHIWTTRPARFASFCPRCCRFHT